MELDLIDLMPITPNWADIAIRLTATIIAGAFIGLDRERGGHVAGLRTTILVGLAACLSMIQANILLATSQSTNGSMDILRFPLGVLTGVGFIGGGAILKRGDITTGVTTAATLWLITAIGLCFGGGQIVVGAIVTILAVLILSPLKQVDRWISGQQNGMVAITLPVDAGIPDLKATVIELSEARFTGLTDSNNGHRELTYEIRWESARGVPGADQIAASLEKNFRVMRFEHRATVS
ncbi:putative Mg2+ transporter-C (MgtC) family protein [Rhizobium sp. BK529]|uniref:MgtC/SapB family protein n=1 Tax=unclassified Rhizobium TaxID=2613769 RepID=UPI00104D32A3|nr:MULTISPECIES: MgtC/SapB family protein [unclassified Rhizobium]MBB3595655.1 putative Mg2+ transporter-C (MgtC) family protein [Rhizobium sp. BK529]TCR98208.1 putative Mg2+ transporter-C (MgtC) family protein [Rhizobium sp. BK418]